ERVVGLVGELVAALAKRVRRVLAPGLHQGLRQAQRDVREVDLVGHQMSSRIAFFFSANSSSETRPASCIWPSFFSRSVGSSAFCLACASRIAVSAALA